MRAWLRFSGRMRRLRHCEGEEETAFKITLILEGLQLPRAKCPSPPISHQSVLHILTKELATRSVSARWVPKLLIDAKQRIQFSISCNNLR